MLAPLRDDTSLSAADLNNDFDFDLANTLNLDLDFTNDQSRCPFAAHIRKTRPRADLEDTAHHIIRAGIPYGPERKLFVFLSRYCPFLAEKFFHIVTDAEVSSGVSDDSLERGLAFGNPIYFWVILTVLLTLPSSCLPIGPL